MDLDYIISTPPILDLPQNSQNIYYINPFDFRNADKMPKIAQI